MCLLFQVTEVQSPANEAVQETSKKCDDGLNADQLDDAEASNDSDPCKFLFTSQTSIYIYLDAHSCFIFNLVYFSFRLWLLVSNHIIRTVCMRLTHAL